MDNYGARINPVNPCAEPEELTEQRQKVKEEGLSAFVSLQYSSGAKLKNQLARNQGANNAFAAARVIRLFVDGFVKQLLEEDLLEEDELQIISEHLYRKLSDVDSALDQVVAILDEIIHNIDLNAILKRYKG